MVNKIIFIIIVTLYVLFLAVSCTGVKHLTKTIDKAFEKKDSTGKSDSVIVSKDSSQFNSEIIIEYDSTKLANKLAEGSDIDWNPFYTPQEFEQVMKSVEHPRRITIRTNVQLHKSDSSVYHATVKVKTETKAVSKEVHQRKTSYWWVLLLIIPALFLLYQKHKKWFTFLGGLKIF